MKLLTKTEATRTGKLDSDEYRMANQIRLVCALESKLERDAYLVMVEHRDGKEWSDTLRTKAREYWNFKKG